VVDRRRKKPRWYQFTLRRIIAAQLLVILCWWLLSDCSMRSDPTSQVMPWGIFIRPKLQLVHGIREITVAKILGSHCVLFYRQDGSHELPCGFTFHPTHGLIWQHWNSDAGDGYTRIW
jgi:hypothetical protein